MSWGTLIASLIGLAASLLKIAERRQIMSTAEDAAVAKAALQVLESTRVGKELREGLAKLGLREADELWERMVK